MTWFNRFTALGHDAVVAWALPLPRRMSKHTKPDKPSPWLSRRQAVWTLAIATLGTLGGGVAWRASRPAAREPDAAGAGLVPRRELRPTRDPASYTGKARRAYEVAGQIPGVLDRLKCYCHCDGYGHVSLLSCYTDNHAST